MFMRQKINTINNNHSIMITTSLLIHFIILTIPSIFALNPDGITLLSFKQSLIHTPLSSLQNWNHIQPDPCSWTGVTCAPQNGPVTGLVLPNSNLIGSIPADFFNHLQHLRVLDLSNNEINGTLPVSLFSCSELQTLSLSSNFISGELAGEIGRLESLQVLNISDNLFSGELPESLGSLTNLIQVSLKSNYFSGGIPNGFDSVKVFDLSSNLITGALPLDFGGIELNYLNLSNNKISGSVLPEFAERIPVNAVVDLSFNNFTGEIPQTVSFSNQKKEYFAGNLNLCGKPLNKMCVVPSSHSIPPNVSSDGTATAAIAAIPKTAGKSGNRGGRKVGLEKIVAIVVGDLAAIVLFAVLLFYAYEFRKKKSNQKQKEIVAVKIDESRGVPTASMGGSTYLQLSGCSCFNRGSEDETSETATEYESVTNNEISHNNNKYLVMVDGETELDIETLLKASAYILGSSGKSIIYKAVVRDGGGGMTTFAVRRIAECGVEKMKEFEKILRVLSKFRHRNLVNVRGFYWGEDEKLLIYDYVSGGSLAAGATYKKVGSSSCHLSFEIRLKIAKGIAKGLSYIHEKKHVHGNIKPSNILLTSELEPVISDFGLKWLISGKPNYIINKSNHNFGTKMSTSSREETSINREHHHSTNNSHGCISPYQAPESTKTPKPNSKWDVYSFGIILLELLSEKVFSDKELGQWNMESSISDNENKILNITKEFATIDVREVKDYFVTCFNLGLNCASLVPQKRPSMKEALQVLEKIPCPL